jgi:NAD(P)-dependent dehydrogenase (short-subunit alcohol dehydrogenase family)
MRILDAQHVTLGFIGLGNMGSRIAQRLLAHGYTLVVFDRNRTKAEVRVPNGAVPVIDVLELARSADVILSCLTNDEAVRSVYGLLRDLPTQFRDGFSVWAQTSRWRWTNPITGKYSSLKFRVGKTPGGLRP